MNNTLTRHFNEVPNMQSLQHQLNYSLFNKLVPIFKDYRETQVITDQSTAEFTGSVEAVTKTILNMKVNLEITTKDPETAFMVIPKLDKNHPLLNSSTRKSLDNSDLRKQLKESLGKVTAEIDSSTGRVDGFLKDIPINIVMGFNHVKRDSNMTPEEATAIYLHELGHAWTFFYMLGGTLRTNVVIHAAMYDYEFGKDSKKDADRMFIIEDSIGGKLTESTASAAKGNEAVAISILNRQVEMQRSEFGTTGFDNSGSEAIADQFLTRMGAGVHVVTALDKLSRRSFAFNTSKVILQILATVATIGLYGAPLLIAILLTDPTTGDYDDPYKRAKRVREQIVASLRNKKLPPEMRRAKLSELDAIDSVMDKVKDNEGLYDFIWRRVIEGGNKRVKAKINQERLESLINNDLYVLGSVLTLNKS